MIKNAENYVSIRWQRASADNIASQIAGLFPFIHTDAGGKDANVNSQVKLLEIEQQLAKAHGYFFKHQYQKAIETYTIAQGLIYQMIKPSFPLNVSVRPGLRFPLDKALFEPLVATSLKFVEVLTPRKIEPDFAVASVDLPRERNQELEVFEDMGINLADNMRRTVHYDSQLADSYADQGEWEKAAYFYQSARKNLGDPQSREEVAAIGAMELNLGGVLVQMDRQEEAREMLTQALRSFHQVGDQVGEAQVYINMGASLTKDNKVEEGKRYINQAKELLLRTSAGGTRVKKGRPKAGLAHEGGSLAQSWEGLSPDFGTGPRSGGTSVQPLRSTARDVLKIEAASLLKGFNGFTTNTQASRKGSLKTNVLHAAVEQNGQAVTYRQVGKGNGWLTQDVESKIETHEKVFQKELGVLVGDKIEKIQWESKGTIATSQIVNKIYDARVNSTLLADINWPYYLPTDFSVQLPHIYYYVIPVALGDCHHALGEFEKAEDFYLKAADYQYINLAVEVPALWQKAARNVLEWGNARYRDDAYQEALDVYRKVLEPPSAPAVTDPEAPLYKHDKLKVTGDTVRVMLENYAESGPGILNPALAAIVLEIRARILQLHAGLDFLGMQVSLVPIWSFEYLQNISRYFAQQVISAERDFINFWDRGENEGLTRQQLEQSTVLAQAERELARQEREAAQQERQVYVEGQDLANLRGSNAQANLNDYAAMSAERIALSRSIAWYSSQNPWERGNPIPSGPDKGKEIHQVIAEKTARQQTITRDYELAAMDRQIDELQQAAAMAQAQVSAATARVEAAQQMEVVAQLKTQFAQDLLTSFNNQVFTPEVWYALGNFMKNICQNYMYMAIRVARMMQRAYNFENDLDRKFIKTNYVINPALGKLAGDALLLDINNFTYDEIATVKRKQMPVRHTLSLSDRFPFLFETQFKTTGKMDFETRLEDFDMAFPGTYSQRIERIEVEVEGILPLAGVRGTLTNGGISRYRTALPGEIKFRIQPKETLVLSEYRIKEDALVFPEDQRLLKIFEGCGTAGTWQLELPLATNDLDFNSITDVKLHFYYQARFDQPLAEAVKAQMAAFAGANLHSRVFSTRWTFPDAFFHFQDSGQLAFSLNVLDFPFHELNPQIKGLALLVATNPGLDPSTLQIRLGVPGMPATIAAAPNAQGEVSVPAGHPWEPLKTGPAIGNYLVEIRPDENPALVVDGRLQLYDLADVVLIVEYEYTPRS